jgi:hypothetical protein
MLVLALLIGGSMRRGPMLHYERMRMAIGFGLNAEDVQVPRQIKSTGEQGDEEATAQPEKEESNVLDWSNSSMIAFATLFYVSPYLDAAYRHSPSVQSWPLVKRSTQKDQLDRSDLPFLEQYVRQAGFKQMHWETDEEGQVKLDDSPDGLGSAKRLVNAPKTYTNWSLLKATWSGRGKVVLSCELKRPCWGSLADTQSNSSCTRRHPYRCWLCPDRIHARDYTKFLGPGWFGQELCPVDVLGVVLWADRGR